MKIDAADRIDPTMTTRIDNFCFVCMEITVTGLGLGSPAGAFSSPMCHGRESTPVVKTCRFLLQFVPTGPPSPATSCG